MIVISIAHERNPGVAPVELQATWGGHGPIQTVEALTGERVDVAIGEWRQDGAPLARVAPRSLTLIGEADTCHACGQKISPKLDATIEGSTFIASKVGVYELEVSDGARRARFRIGVIPREAVQARPVATYLQGFNAGKPRSMPARRAILREWVRTLDAKAIEALTAERPIPPGVSFSAMGG